MEPEDISVAEIPEKVGLKRKLTGPPRLLLGKTKSSAQDEKKSDAQALRKQRRDKNNDVVEEHQGNNHTGCESHQVHCQSPQTAFTSEEGETHTDFQEEPLASLSTSDQSRVEGHGKSRLRRSRAKATIRRVFSPAFVCVRRRKQLDTVSEDTGDNATHGAQNSVQELSGDSFNTTEKCEPDLVKNGGQRKGKRKFWVRLWPILKRFSITSSNNQKQGKGCRGQDNGTFFEITSEKSLEKSSSTADQSDYRAPEPSGDKAMAEQLKGSSEIHEDMAGIHEESCPQEDPEHKKEATEKMTLSAEVSADLDSHGKMEQGHSLEQDANKCEHPNVKDEEDILCEMLEPGELFDSVATATCDSRASTCIAANNVVVVNDLDQIAPVENDVRCKPIITIEDVHSSDEEKHEPMESDVHQPNTLSPLVSVNGSCHRIKVNRKAKDTLPTLDHSNSTSSCSEILLVQTAFSLVHAAISGAVEQLSAEVQSNQIDQDHA